ncbi:MAG: hypothetical protein OHK0056_04290 [Bacteriovoracaceae bacterium]
MVFDSDQIDAKKINISTDKQIVIDLKNTKASEKTIRPFDTSEFSGSVVFVSAYPKPGAEKDMRVAVQLRDNVRSVLRKEGNRVLLEVENRFGVFNQATINDFDKLAKETASEEDENVSNLLIPKSDSVEDILENLTMSGRKKYVGKRITLNVRDVTVEDLLKMISETSGFNIILTKEVKELNPMTLNLTNVPWDQALDTILSLNKLVAKKNGIILMVQTFDSAKKEQQEIADAKSLSLKQEPLVTKVFLISYAETKELIKILTEYLTKDRGKISEDPRTNSLIVKDTPDVIEKIRKIVETLDTQTPQVLIESKIIEVNETYAKEIGLREGINFGYDPVGQIGDGEPATVGETVQPGVDAGPGFQFSSAPTNTPGNVRNLFGLTVTRFSRLLNLNFTLQLMETESKGKVLSSPKVITQNKKKAKLTAKKTDSFRKVEGTGQDQTTSFEEVEASLALEVTPQITNEGSIVLDISISKEDFGERPSPDAPPKKTGSSVATNVLVDNGSTIVLGGLYEYTKREQHSGVPFLKDIPLIGWLFRTPYAPGTTKRELIIFLTPRIINQEEAGIVDQV